MRSPLRLLIVAQEFPYPPNHGGRADVWRRLQVLRRLGCQIALVCWYDNVAEKRPSPPELSAVREVVDLLEIVPIRRGLIKDALRGLRILHGLPSHVASRVMENKDFTRIMAGVKAFAPEAMLLDSLYGGAFAMAARDTLDVPMFYRAHNIEHRYFASQAAAAVCLRDRFAWRLACRNLERFESRVLCESTVWFDISIEDLEFWRQRGFLHGHWLPPLPEACVASQTVSVDAQLSSEVAFLGNLNAPNNVRGVQWLVSEVMPIVWSLRPATELTIAGSAPKDEVRALIASDPRLRLFENVENAVQFISGAQVLVNPVLSGSGVNVKTLDMLMTNRPIVSTPQGVAGLIPELKALCAVVEEPESFARSIVEQLETTAVDLAKREQGRKLFLGDAVRSVLDLMTANVKARKSQPVHGSGGVCTECARP